MIRNAEPKDLSRIAEILVFTKRIKYRSIFHNDEYSYFFWKEGIGSKLVEFAKEKFDSKFVWTLEKNEDAIRFYEAHGFKLNGKRQLEEGTPEYIVMLERD